MTGGMRMTTPTAPALALLLGALAGLAIVLAAPAAASGSGPPYDCTSLVCDPCKAGKAVKVDFVFVIDGSPSMGPFIDKASNGTVAMVDEILARDIDARFWLVFDGTTPELVLNGTGDYDEVKDVLSRIEPFVDNELHRRHGDDEAEFECVQMALGVAPESRFYVGKYLNATRGVDDLTSMRLRADAKPVFLVITDEDDDRPVHRLNRLPGMDTQEPWGCPCGRTLYHRCLPRMDRYFNNRFRVWLPVNFTCPLTIEDRACPPEHVDTSSTGCSIGLQVECFCDTTNEWSYTRGPWAQHLNNTVAALVARNATTYFFVRRLSLSYQQYGYPACDVAAADLSRYDQQATLACLRNRSATNNLDVSLSAQAQLLASNVLSRSIELNDIGVDVVREVFRGIVATADTCVARRKRVEMSAHRWAKRLGPPVCEEFKCDTTVGCMHIKSCDPDCVEQCLIGGVCYNSGEADPSDSDFCRVCSPDQNRTAWTTQPLCGPTVTPGPTPPTPAPSVAPAPSSSAGGGGPTPTPAPTEADGGSPAPVATPSDGSGIDGGGNPAAMSVTQIAIIGGGAGGACCCLLLLLAIILCFGMRRRRRRAHAPAVSGRRMASRRNTGRSLHGSSSRSRGASRYGNMHQSPPPPPMATSTYGSVGGGGIDGNGTYMQTP